MKKCPEEIKYAIFKLAGPLTKYLNGRMDLSSEFDKRLIRRDAIQIGWRGEYSELFISAGLTNYDTEIADIIINQSKEFHYWLLEHLERNNRLLNVLLCFRSLDYMDWWKDSINSFGRDEFWSHFKNAIRCGNVGMVQFIMTNEELRKKDLDGSEEDCGFYIDMFICCSHKFTKTDPVDADVFRKAAESKMLWIIIQNVELSSWVRAMSAATFIGDIEIVKWLHENHRDCCTTDAMNDAAIHGHLDIVKFLHENRTE